MDWIGYPIMLWHQEHRSRAMLIKFHDFGPRRRKDPYSSTMDVIQFHGPQMHIKRRQPCDSLSPRSCLTAKIRLKNWDALTKRHYYNEITNNESFNKTFLLGFTTVLIFGIPLDHCNWTIHLFSNHSQFPLAFSLHILNSPWLSYTKRMCCPLASLDSVTIYLDLLFHFWFDNRKQKPKELWLWDEMVLPLGKPHRDWVVKTLLQMRRRCWCKQNPTAVE